MQHIIRTILMGSFIMLLVLLFPLAEFTRLTIAPNVSLTLTDLGVGVVCLTSVIFLIYKRSLSDIYVLKPLGLFIGIGILSLSINAHSYTANHVLIAALYLLRFAAYGWLCIVSLQISRISKSLVKRLLVISGGVLLALGYAQFFFYPALRNLLYLGWDEHYYRMFSSFFDPNFLGTFLVLYLVFLLPSLIEIQSRNIQWYGLALLASAILGGIFLTFSRGAYLMLLISVVVFFVLRGSKKLATMFVLVVCIVVVLFIEVNPSKNEGNNLLRITSTLAHIRSSQSAWHVFVTHPILGVGFDAYRYAQNTHISNSTGVLEDHAGAGTDNSFLFVLGTTGIVGFAAYTYVLFSILKLSYIARHKSKWGLVIFSSLIGLMVNSLFINSLFFPFILIWLWILLGMFVYSYKQPLQKLK